MLTLEVPTAPVAAVPRIDDGMGAADSVRAMAQTTAGGTYSLRTRPRSHVPPLIRGKEGDSWIAASVRLGRNVSICAG